MAKYFKGGFSITDQMKLDFKNDIWPWWKRMERQIAEDTIIQDASQNDKPVPVGVSMERAVDKKIKEWRMEAGE